MTSEKPFDVTAPVVIEFVKNLFSRLADKYGGSCTLNELRVMNQVILCSTRGKSCRVTSLHKVTGIPKSTVSRIVTKLQGSGWLSDRRDPTDGRRRIISLGPRSLEVTSNDIDATIRWINEFRERGTPTENPSY